MKVDDHDCHNDVIEMIRIQMDSLWTQEHGLRPLRPDVEGAQPLREAGDGDAGVCGVGFGVGRPQGPRRGGAGSGGVGAAARSVGGALLHDGDAAADRRQPNERLLAEEPLPDAGGGRGRSRSRSRSRARSRRDAAAAAAAGSRRRRRTGATARDPVGWLLEERRNVARVALPARRRRALSRCVCSDLDDRRRRRRCPLPVAIAVVERSRSGLVMMTSSSCNLYLYISVSKDEFTFLCVFTRNWKGESVRRELQIWKNIQKMRNRESCKAAFRTDQT